MKKVGVLFLFLFLVSGCGKPPDELERGIMLRSALLQGNRCTFDAEITADYGDRLYQFSLKCQGNAEGDVNFTVTAPETIAGIAGNISDAGGKLTFDDVALQFDTMTDDQISPVTAPWIFLKTLRSGYLSSAGTEEGMLRLTIDDSYDDDALHLDIWIDPNNKPIAAEILYDDLRILSLKIDNFTIM